MFNGIIKNIGIVKKIHKNSNDYVLEINSNIKFKKNNIGMSISCSGVCLTLLSFAKKTSKFFISKETLNVTNFKDIRKNDKINLELPIKFGDRISGHFVQGHVDTTEKIQSIKKIGSSWNIKFSIKNNFRKYIIKKGSIAINGISLTVSKINKKSFEIYIIPHTLKLTNLIFLKKKDLVNIEFDILRKYAKL